MGKIVALLLFVAAVIVAAVYLLKGKRIEKEDVQEAHGWRRHLLAATALVLALAGGIGLGNADAPEGQSATKPGSEKPDEISAAWAQLRTVWREIDAYSSMKEKDFLKETEEKRARHTDAMGTLVAAGALPKPVGDILQTSFASTASSATERLPVKWENIRPSCYEMTALGAAGLRAQGQLAESAMHLAGLEASGKLSPAVVEKTRKQIARDMRMIMYAKVRPKHVDVSALLKAHFDGEEFEIPVEVEQAADMLMQLLTSDEPPALPKVEPVGRIMCYEVEALPPQDRGREDLDKAEKNVDELEAVDKLSPETADKAREQIERERED
jgi:hypothetical protein